MDVDSVVKHSLGTSFTVQCWLMFMAGQASVSTCDSPRVEEPSMWTRSPPTIQPYGSKPSGKSAPATTRRSEPVSITPTWLLSIEKAKAAPSANHFGADAMSGSADFTTGVACEPSECGDRKMAGAPDGSWPSKINCLPSGERSGQLSL